MNIKQNRNLAVPERVENGFQWLDATVGRGKWERRIVMKRFDMVSTCKCVLGFVFAKDVGNGKNHENGFSVGLSKLGGPRSCDKYGFDSGEGDIDEYIALQAEWTRRLRLRRAELRRERKGGK